ncbi:DUF488 domain-containing protein [Nitrosomonas sp. Nm166]|uniref:DUF488 domain-containing protein n=1 Tax=Nitrosomonas sp. Nm166 TaxID=1881054 RepID=UPI0008F10CC4|nr:DUF488 domain-containing protein [Nitrosomonas sp. Nm166]SFE31057.1 Uncharacterized conserved protein YeaO, DUF488 family [Nitrosomonas sp. Nm166]
MSYSTNTMSAIKIKRVYEKATKDEYRVLVDRLWPRGLTKEQAAIDLWLKEIAPSSELRKWFGHDPKKFLEFRTRYVEELAQNPAVAILSNLLTKHKNVVLLYAAKSGDINHAIVLKGFMESRR